MKMNNELIAKAKEAKTAEELMALAKESGEEITEESAKAYFDLLNPKTGELSDDERMLQWRQACHFRNALLR